MDAHQPMAHTTSQRQYPREGAKPSYEGNITWLNMFRQVGATRIILEDAKYTQITGELHFVNKVEIDPYDPAIDKTLSV